jgi:hypothetical protein
VTRERLRRRPADPAPDAPAPPAEHFLLGLQRSAGNVAVRSLLARQPTAHHTDTAHGDLYDWEVTDELARVQGYRFSELAIRTFQAALTTPETGAFSAADVRAIAHARVRHGLSRNAVIDAPFLNLVVHFAAHHHLEDDAIHLVVEYHRLDVSADTLSLRFAPAQMFAVGVAFESSGGRMITLGAQALVSQAAVRGAVEEALAKPVPAGPALGPQPSPILADWTVTAAIDFDAAHVLDPRSLHGIQQALMVPHTDGFDGDTVEAIARLQQARGLSAVDGKIDHATLEALVGAMVTARAEHSVIRLVIDYKRIPDAGVVAAEVDFSLTGPDDFVRGGAASATRDAIRFAPALFRKPPAQVVATIERALRPGP